MYELINQNKMTIEELKKAIGDVFYGKRADPNRIIPYNTWGNLYKKLTIKKENEKI